MSAVITEPERIAAREAVLICCEAPDDELLLAEFRDRWPQIAVVVLSANQDNASIKKSLSLGAVGFIPKSSSRNVMLAAFKLVLAGGVYVPPEIFVV